MLHTEALLRDLEPGAAGKASPTPYARRALVSIALILVALALLSVNAAPPSSPRALLIADTIKLMHGKADVETLEALCAA